MNLTYSPTVTNHSSTTLPAPSHVTTTYVGILLCIITVALLGNIAVIIVFIGNRRFRVSSSYYIFSLAVADVITASLVSAWLKRFVKT